MVKRSSYVTVRPVLHPGRQEGLRRSLEEHYADHEIGVVTCLGHCHSNDAFMVNGEIRVSGGDGTATGPAD